MAIAENMLKVEEIVEANVSSSFNTVSDAISKAKAAASTVASYANAVSSVINTVKNLNVSSLTSLATSVFDSAVCICNNNSGSYSSRVSSGQSNLSMSLVGYASTCTCSSSAMIYDAIMSVATTVETIKGILSSDLETVLKNLIKSELQGILQELGLGKSVPSSLINTSVGTLYGEDKIIGPTLSGRKTLDDMLYQNNGASSLIDTTGTSSWLTTSAVSSMLCDVVSVDTTQAYELIEKALSVAGLRDTTLRSLFTSLTHTEHYATRNKISVAYDVITSGKLFADDKMSMKVNAGAVLNALDVEKSETNPTTVDPSSDFEKILTVLNTADGGWSENNTNFYKASENKTLTELATYKLKEYRETINLTGEYTTSLNPEHHIAIINTFNNSCDCGSSSSNSTKTVSTSSISTSSSSCASCS